MERESKEHLKREKKKQPLWCIYDDFHLRIYKHFIDMFKGDITDNLQNEEACVKQKFKQRKAHIVLSIECLGTLATRYPNFSYCLSNARFFYNHRLHKSPYWHNLWSHVQSSHTLQISSWLAHQGAWKFTNEESFIYSFICSCANYVLEQNDLGLVWVAGVPHLPRSWLTTLIDYSAVSWRTKITPSICLYNSPT